MKRSNLFAAAAILSAVISAPLIAQAQEMGGAMGPGSRYGLEPEPAPGYYGGPDAGYGYTPYAATGVVGGAANTAGAIATAPFRALDGNDSYAMARGSTHCMERYRSYDPASGTFMGYDGRRRPCP